jgi:holliday junction DNA helicase RuvA
MITKLTGILNRVLEEEVRLQVGPIEYQVLVPEFIRRKVQNHLNEDVHFVTMQYFEGNLNTGKMVPRLVGFLSETELEFFELFCTVEKIGVKKGLKALIRPIKEIADAIQRQDVKWLTTLPGIGPASAEQVIATLRRKVTKFALMPDMRTDGKAASVSVMPDLVEDAHRALLSVGHNPLEAHRLLDAALAGGRSYKSVEDLLQAIYAKP